MTDEAFLTQADPMKVLPPADDVIIGNTYGTIFMNIETFRKIIESDFYRENLKFVRDKREQSMLDKVFGIIEKHISWADTDYESKKLMRMKNEILALRGEEQ